MKKCKKCEYLIAGEWHECLPKRRKFIDAKVKDYLERAEKILLQTFLKEDLDEEAIQGIDRMIEIAKMIQREDK